MTDETLLELEASNERKIKTAGALSLEQGGRPVIVSLTNGAGEEFSVAIVCRQKNSLRCTPV